MNHLNSLTILKIITFSSILFVWVIRYDNIVAEFKDYGLPNWLRDLVGILKISSVIMLISDKAEIVLTGASSLIFLMLAAFLTHLRIKNPFSKMIPSLTLLLISVIVFLGTYN